MLQKFPLFYHEIILHPPPSTIQGGRIFQSHPHCQIFSPLTSSSSPLTSSSALFIHLFFIFQVTQKYLAMQNTMTSSPAFYFFYHSSDAKKYHLLLYPLFSFFQVTRKYSATQNTMTSISPALFPPIIRMTHAKNSIFDI